ncbi:MAG: SBBP repeat-containing protein, partial [Nitrosopumilus sp.]
YGYGIAVDGNGNVYVTGYEFRSDLGESNNIWVRKYSQPTPTSVLIEWTTTYNSSNGNNDRGFGIAVDGNGNVYVTGCENRTDLGEGNNIWVRKYNTDGLIQWTTTYNSPNDSSDYGYGIAVDGNGNVYVTGYEERSGEGYNIWVRKYNTDGLIQWTTTYNDPNDNIDIGKGIAVDGNGNVYVTGYEVRTDLGEGYNIWV